MKNFFVSCFVILTFALLLSCSKGGSGVMRTPPANNPPDTTTTGGQDTTVTGGTDTTVTGGNDTTGSAIVFKTLVVPNSIIRVNSDGSIVAMVFSDGGYAGTTHGDDLETDTRKGTDVTPHFVNPGNIEPTATFDSATQVYFVDFANKTVIDFRQSETAADTATVMNFQFTKDGLTYIVYPTILQVAGYGSPLNAAAIAKFGSTKTAYDLPPATQD